MSLHNPFLRLYTKMQCTARRLRLWARSRIGNNRLLLAAAKQLILILDVVQEHKILTPQELLLKRDLKNRLLTMAAIEKLRARQQSRITFIKAGDANSKYFFLSANGRRRKNFIKTLNTGQRVIHRQEEKEKAILDHFSSVLGSTTTRNETLNWEPVNLSRQDLQHLEADFTEEEIKETIMDLKPESAPGPDGFIGIFLKTCWDIIKDDLILAVHYFQNLHEQHFNILNSAHIVLIPRTTEAAKITDYSPISLTSNIAKIISKILANCLSLSLTVLVSRNQSAFIRK